MTQSALLTLLDAAADGLAMGPTVGADLATDAEGGAQLGPVVAADLLEPIIPPVGPVVAADLDPPLLGPVVAADLEPDDPIPQHPSV